MKPPTGSEHRKERTVPIPPKFLDHSPQASRTSTAPRSAVAEASDVDLMFGCLSHAWDDLGSILPLVLPSRLRALAVRLVALGVTVNG